MTIAEQIAQHFKDFYFEKNWTWVWLKETLEDVTWEQATMRVHSLNSIASLVHHIYYYADNQIRVLEGGPLEGTDKESWITPAVTSEEDWQSLIKRTQTIAERWASLVENLTTEQLGETFADEKYGTVYRNLAGVIEHAHYHLGQIVLIKKLIASKMDA